MVKTFFSSDFNVKNALVRHFYSQPNIWVSFVEFKASYMAYIALLFKQSFCFSLRPKINVLNVTNCSSMLKMNKNIEKHLAKRFVYEILNLYKRKQGTGPVYNTQNREICILPITLPLTLKIYVIIRNVLLVFDPNRDNAPYAFLF